MEVPPLKNCRRTNRQTTKFMNSVKNCASILHKKILKKIKILPVCNMLSQMTNYNALFYDDILFNFQQGIPFIKNAVLCHVLLTGHLVCLQSFQYSQSAYVSRANTNKPWWQTYRYSNGF